MVGAGIFADNAEHLADNGFEVLLKAYRFKKPVDHTFVLDILFMYAGLLMSTIASHDANAPYALLLKNGVSYTQFRMLFTDITHAMKIQSILE